MINQPNNDNSKPNNQLNTLINRLKRKKDILNHQLKPTQNSVASLKPPQSTSSSVSPILPTNQLSLPVIPIREGVLFPNTESILTFGRKISLNAIEAVNQTDKLIILLTQKKARTPKPKPEELYQIGTLALVERTLKTEENISALVRGIGRVKVINYIQLKPYIRANILKIDDIFIKDNETMALASHLQRIFKQVVQMGKPVEFLNFMRLMSGVNEGQLADQIASTLNIKTIAKQKLLEIINVKDRIKKIIAYLNKEIKILQIEKDVVHKTQAKFDKHMRESVLRERMKTIQKELGEIEDDESVAIDYEQKLKKIKLNENVKEKIEKEIKRLKQMSVNNPESGYVRTWLDTIFELPWNQENTININLIKAKAILEKNHHALDEVKDRIQEYIAVLQLRQEKNKNNKHASTILCFVGPPGVGKTSIGRSIAEALGRKFTKISLGGIRDEADIRGHRRTYVGAMVGRIIKGIMQAKTTNPIFMLDEIDKIGQDFRGDPAAALLEVLDPEQNRSFEDHYLDFPFDLSQVMFITTANTLATVPPALRDRLEVINFSGYTFEDKFQITKKHLLNKVLENNALKKEQIKLADDDINHIIQRYTREAGVRDLERNLEKIMRKVAKKIIEKKESKKKIVNQIIINQKTIEDFLGPEKYDITLTEKKAQVGLATGLAWTSVGGDVLFIEVALTPGKGEIKLTGKLGEVMKESAQAALTYTKANAHKFNIDLKKFAKTDVHVHVPEGAIPKDGPSAGITITTAMVSAFTNRPVKKDLAMTGEITLRGRVLRIGGLKEKVLAAHRAGVKTIIIPQENQRDLVDIPKNAQQDLAFKAVEHMDEVINLALLK